MKLNRVMVHADWPFDAKEAKRNMYLETGCGSKLVP